MDWINIPFILFLSREKLSLKGNGVMTENIGLWNRFAASGKIEDYLLYCSSKEGNGFDNYERENVKRCTGHKGIECRGER